MKSYGGFGTFEPLGPGSGQSLHQIERLAVLMAQSEGNESMRDHGSDQSEGGKSGSRIGAAFADRIQETLTQMRLMCKRASKFLWVR